MFHDQALKVTWCDHVPTVGSCQRLLKPTVTWCMSMEIGKRIPASRRISRLGVFCLCLCCVASSAAQPSRLGEIPTLFGRPAVPHDYLRAADVARQCRSVLFSAAELTAPWFLIYILPTATGARTPATSR